MPRVRFSRWMWFIHVMGVLPAHIEQQVREETARRGMILLEVKRRGERGSSILEIVVDSESGVKLDELTELSRWIGALLDEGESALPGRYKLEVSSAGLDRPLEHVWQYRKNVGRLVKLTFDDEQGVRSTGLFTLAGVADDGIVVSPRRKGRAAAEPVRVPFAHVACAVIEPDI